MTSPLISTAEFDQRRTDGKSIVFDASYYLPNETTDAQACFAAAHIPGAAFLDIDTISDSATDLPHMVPSAARFATAVESLGVSNSSPVIVYDQRGLFSAARVWWLFTVFGHPNVQVLDGGLPKWQREHRETETGAARPRARGHFVPQEDRTLIRSRSDLEANLHSKFEVVLDARAAGRFSGKIAEPRPGMRGGHIPGAISLPFTDLLQPDGSMLAPQSLRELFASKGLDRDSRLITMCGSGVTAAVITLGLVCAGWPIGTLYDGSWAEWGRAGDTPVEESR